MSVLVEIAREVNMDDISGWKNILEAYYVDGKTDKWTSEYYGLNWPSKLYLMFPIYTYPDFGCEACGGWMISKFMDRKSELSAQTLRFDLFEGDLPLPDALAKKYRDYRDEYDFGALKTPEGYLLTLPKCGRCDHVPLISCHCHTCRVAGWAKSATYLSVQ